VGETNRFTTPATYSDLVLVPTRTGVVYVRTRPAPGLAGGGQVRGGRTACRPTV
jgi:hypothetical protein